MRRVRHAFAWIFVVAAVASIIAPRIVGRSGSGYSPTISEMSALKAELDHFHLDCGRYPTTAEGLRALVTLPTNSKLHWGGPYSNHVIDRDEWGSPYPYRSDGRSYTLTSFGTDRKPGGEGYDADLVETNGG